MSLRSICLSTLLAMVGSPVLAGSFFLSSSLFTDLDSILHPYLYFGQGGTLQIEICIDPASDRIPEMEPAIRRAVETWNHLEPQLENSGSDPSIPAGFFDFEMMILHEIGHCAFGLGHTALGALVEFPIPDSDCASDPDPATCRIFEGFYTLSDRGEDDQYHLFRGPDDQRGSLDDSRDDDVNRFWFRKIDNDPFTLSDPVDATTYSRNLSDLPTGHSFPANANFSSGASGSPPIRNTDAVLFPTQLLGQATRALGHDDVAMVRLASSGVDGVESTADDYDIEMLYAGISADTGTCDVIITTDSEETFGRCEASSISIGANHFRLAGTGRIYVSLTERWFFGPLFADGFESGDASRWSGSAQSTSNRGARPARAGTPPRGYEHGRGARDMLE